MTATISSTYLLVGESSRECCCLFIWKIQNRKKTAGGFAVPDANLIGQCRFYREGVVLCIEIQCGLVRRNTYVFR